MDRKRKARDGFSANGGGAWSFRREVTLGHVLQLLAVVGMVMAAWSNLQKELAMIGQELGQLNAAQVKISGHMEDLAEKSQEYEYRLRYLENGGVRAALTVPKIEPEKSNM